MSTYVLFIGGYHATQTDMNVWLGSAKAQQPDVDFDALPWPPGAGADANGAVSSFTKAGQYGSAITAIESSGADRIYIVGHSSGCAIANAVDRGLKDHSNVVLVALDGFSPNGKQLARPSTQVWAAVCGDVKSRNYKALKEAVGARLQVYKATDCKTMWALHFSLVNAAASDKVVKDIRTGYAQCRANLVWL
jgi:hypothetical protein